MQEREREAHVFSARPKRVSLHLDVRALQFFTCQRSGVCKNAAKKLLHLWAEPCFCPSAVFVRTLRSWSVLNAFSFQRARA